MSKNYNLPEMIKKINPGTPFKALFLSPMSWAKYKQALKILGINTSNFDPDENIMFESKSSFARSLKNMDDIGKKTFDKELEQAKELNLKSPTESRFTIGEMNGSPSFSGPYIKESARLTLFIYDAIFSKLENKTIQFSKKDMKSKFSPKPGDSMKLKWLNSDFEVFYRFHPIYDLKDDYAYFEFSRVSEIAGKSPADYLVHLWSEGTGITYTTEERTYINLYLDVSAGFIECYFFYKNPNTYEKNESIEEYWDIENPRDAFPNWLCFKVTIGEGGTLKSIHDNSDIFWAPYYNGDTALAYSENEHAPFMLASNDSKPSLPKKSDKPKIDEYEILEFVKKLDSKQAKFLQDLLELKNK